MSHFVVEFTKSATDEFNKICDWYEQHSIQAADKWLDAVGRMLDQLELDPSRFPDCNDKQISALRMQECSFGAGRQLTHRFIYSVRPGNKVIVYAIRHLAQQELTGDDL